MPQNVSNCCTDLNTNLQVDFYAKISLLSLEKKLKIREDKCGPPSPWRVNPEFKKIPFVLSLHSFTPNYPAGAIMEQYFHLFIDNYWQFKFLTFLNWHLVLFGGV